VSFSCFIVGLPNVSERIVDLHALPPLCEVLSAAIANIMLIIMSLVVMYINIVH